MVKTIWKYPLTSRHMHIRTSCHCYPRYAGLDPTGRPCIWIEVLPVPDEQRIWQTEVRMHYTGEELPEFGTYLNSFEYNKLMCHIYYN